MTIVLQIALTLWLISIMFGVLSLAIRVFDEILYKICKYSAVSGVVAFIVFAIHNIWTSFIG